MICWASELIEQLEPTGLNPIGMAMRLAHAWGVNGEDTTLMSVSPGGFSSVDEPRGTTTSQHWGTLVPVDVGWSDWPHPSPGACSPVWTWNSCWPVPS